MNDIATDARALNIASAMNKTGMKVCIISYYTSKKDKLVNIEGIDVYNIKKSGAPRLALRWIKFYLRALKAGKLITAGYYWAADLYSLSVARKMAASEKKFLYYDSREIYSSLASLASKPLEQRILAWLEKKWVKDVDKIIVSGELDAEYLKENLISGKPYYTVMNVPPYKYKPAANKIREHYPEATSGKKILIYQGMISEGRGISSIVQALPYLEDCILFIIGEGDFTQIIQNTALSLNVNDRVLIYGMVPYKELPLWTASADIGISIIKPVSYSYNLALPNKLFEYIMAGIPSLITELPAMQAILDKYKIGYSVKPNVSPQDIARAITYINIPENYSHFVSECEKAAKEYCYEKQMEVVRGLFE